MAEEKEWKQEIEQAGGRQKWWELVLAVQPAELVEMEKLLDLEPAVELDISNTDNLQYYWDISDDELEEVVGDYKQLCSTSNDPSEPVWYDDGKGGWRQAELDELLTEVPPSEEEFAAAQARLFNKSKPTKRKRVSDSDSDNDSEDKSEEDEDKDNGNKNPSPFFTFIWCKLVLLVLFSIWNK